MKLRRLLLVPTLIGTILSQGAAYGAVTSSQARSPDSTSARSGTSQLSVREIYRRGYLAGYRAAAQRYRGESRKVYVPADTGSGIFSIAARSETESSVTGSGYISFRALPSIAVTPEFKVTGQFGIKNEFGTSHESTAEDGLLILTHSGAKISKVTSFSPRVEIALPISEKSRATDSLVTSFKLMPKLDFDFSPLGAHGLSSYTRLNFTKFFHSSNTTHESSPSPNTSMKLAPEVGLGYAISTPLSLSVGGMRTFKWDYEGAASNGFLVYQELGISIGKSLSIGLGHYSSGSLDGDKQFTLAAEDASTLYGVFTYSL